MGRKSVDKTRNANPRRRKKYLMKLLPIFYEYGLQQLSMDDISSKLNVSKATLYNYFASKEEMVSAALAHILGEISPFVQVLKDRERPFLERYIHAIELLSIAVKGISNLAMADLKDHYPHLWQQVRDFQQFAADQMETFYNEARKAGILEGHSTEILVLGDRLFFDALTDPAVLEANNLSLEQAFRDYFRLKLFGMLSSSARREMGKEALELLEGMQI